MKLSGDSPVLVGNMLVTELDTPGELRMKCCQCDANFIFSDNPGRLKNYRYKPDFLITAQCPNCKATWEPGEDLDDLDETLLFLVSIEYTVVAPGGKRLIEKTHSFPRCETPMINVIIETFAKARNTCRITSINVETITKKQYAEETDKLLNRLHNTMEKLFTSIFGDNDVPES